MKKFAFIFFNFFLLSGCMTEKAPFISVESYQPNIEIGSYCKENIELKFSNHRNVSLGKYYSNYRCDNDKYQGAYSHSSQTYLGGITQTFFVDYDYSTKIMTVSSYDEDIVENGESVNDIKENLLYAGETLLRHFPFYLEEQLSEQLKKEALKKEIKNKG